MARRAQHRHRLKGQYLYDRNLRREADPEVHVQGTATRDEGLPRHALAGVREVGSASVLWLRPVLDGITRRRWSSWHGGYPPSPPQPLRLSATRWRHGPTSSPEMSSPSRRTSTAISGSPRRTAPSGSTAHAFNCGDKTPPADGSWVPLLRWPLPRRVVCGSAFPVGAAWSGFFAAASQSIPRPKAHRPT